MGTAPTSPSARRLAEEKGVDIGALEGSGPRGHVLKEDVMNLSTSNTGRIFISPLARRTATERQIALERIIGTGPNGRIIEADILSAGQSGATFEEVRLSAMRKTIAWRMTKAKQEIPHFYLSMDANIDRLLAIRADYNTLDPDNKASLNDFIIRATALALAERTALSPAAGTPAGCCHNVRTRTFPENAALNALSPIDLRTGKITGSENV